jgi:hypothetical protein
MNPIAERYAHAVLLLLDLQHRAVLEAPLHNICLLACTLDELAALDGGVAATVLIWPLEDIRRLPALNSQLREVLELDEVPACHVSLLTCPV